MERPAHSRLVAGLNAGEPTKPVCASFTHGPHIALAVLETLDGGPATPEVCYTSRRRKSSATARLERSGVWS